MAKYQKNRSSISDKTQQEALDLSHQVLTPSELKLHRKVVSQGIQKGIDLYKKQQKSKVRELDKQLKKVADRYQPEDESLTEKVVVKQHWLPWTLLALSWVVFFLCAVLLRDLI